MRYRRILVYAFGLAGEEENVTPDSLLRALGVNQIVDDIHSAINDEPINDENEELAGECLYYYYYIKEMLELKGGEDYVT